MKKALILYFVFKATVLNVTLKKYSKWSWEWFRKEVFFYE